MEHFYIMNASSLFDNKATDIAGIIEQWEGEGQTIIVAKRETGYDKFSRIFISGSACESDYGVKADDFASYTQDTGMGHRNEGKDLIIENVLYVGKDGKIKSKNNDIGLDEKRRCWVMK